MNKFGWIKKNQHLNIQKYKFGETEIPSGGTKFHPEFSILPSKENE